MASELLSAIEDHLLAQSSNEGTPEPRAATSLAEFCLVLMRRWQTKCAGADMSLWIDRVGGFLRSLAAPTCPWESLPARCRAAAVGISATALRASSHFKLDNEAEALCDWIDSVTVIVQRAFRMEPKSEEEEDSLQEDQFAIVTVDLLTMLIHRIKEPAEWFPPLHRHVLVQTLLAKLNEAMIAERQPELCQSILGLLCLVAKCPQGFDALLTSNLSHLVWMPLSDVGKRRGFPGSSGAQWARVFRLSLNLAALLQAQGGRLSLQNTLDVLVLLQERLTSFVALPRALLNGTDEARLMVESISIAADFMKYFKQVK